MTGNLKPSIIRAFAAELAPAIQMLNIPDTPDQPATAP